VVNAVRQAPSDDARHPRFTRTVHGFGHAFGGEGRESGGGRNRASDALERPYPQAPTGWKLEPGPFPGWEKLPER